VISAPLSTSDIYPTLLAAAGIPLPSAQAKLDGENILPLLTDPQLQRQSPIFFQSPIRGVKYEADSSQLQYAMSVQRFKLFSGDAGRSWQLYDLQDDPAESRDVSTDFPDIVEAMRTELLNWTKETRRDAQRHLAP
ncbi:MAG: sulfatase/phosphatase domain-containing protein, partial [Halioglobus sp.]